MDRLQGQLKNGLAEVIFHRVILSKNYSKGILLSPHIVKKKSDRAEILQKHAYGQSTMTVKKWFG